MSKRTFLAAITSVVFLGAGGCDALRPVQSEGAPDPLIRAAQPLASASGGGARIVGSYTGPTGVASPGQVTTGAAVQPIGIVLQPNTYVLIRVGGTMVVQTNPYRAGARSGNAVFSYSADDTRQSTGRGLTTVYMRPWGTPTMGEPLTPHLRADQGGRDVVLLVRVGSAGAELLAGRDQMPGRSLYWGYCPTPYCPDKEVIQPDTSIHWPVWIEDYWISTAHEVTATQIDKPLRIASPGFAAGKLVAVEARLFEGLRIRDRAGMPATVNWRWYPGDTAATPNPYIAAQAPPGCQDKLVCQFTPTRAGRMRVFTTVEGAAVDESQVLGVTPDPTLTLECTNPVVRGTEMNCTATPRPGPATEVEWSFTDTEGNTVRGPTERLTWGGIMVVGGTMNVSAKINGTRVPATPVTVVVTPRPGWQVSFPAMPEPERSPMLVYPPVLIAGAPVGDGVLGQHTTTYGLSGLLGAGTGPNQNWYYLRKPLEISNAQIHINPGLYPDDPFFRAQIGGTDSDGYRRCDRRFMNSAREFVHAHERRHHEIAQEFYTGPGSVTLESSRVHSPPSHSSDEVVASLLASTISELERLQAAFDSTSMLRMTCKLETIPHRGGGV
jgi:hypothetical protein